MSIDISRPYKAQRSTSMFSMSSLFKGETFSNIFNHGTIVGDESTFFKRIHENSHFLETLDLHDPDSHD